MISGSAATRRAGRKSIRRRMRRISALGPIRPDVLRRQFTPDLYDMPQGFRPGQRQPAGQDARSCDAPNLVWLKPCRQCRREGLHRTGDIRTERDQRCPAVAAILACPALHDGEIYGRHRHNLGTEPGCFQRPCVWLGALGHKDRRLLAQRPSDMCQGGLCATLGWAGIDNFLHAVEHLPDEPGLGAARVQIVADHPDPRMGLHDRVGYS